MGTTWLVDEPYVKILGGWHYLYLGVDQDNPLSPLLYSSLSIFTDFSAMRKIEFKYNLEQSSIRL